MASIQDALITAINAHTFSFPLTAQKLFDQSITLFPRVVISEIVNTPHTIVSADTRAEMEATTVLGYQLEVYARDAIKSDVAYDRTTVCDTLRQELTAFIWSEVGLIRNSQEPPVTPDGDAVMGIIRVNGVVDRAGYIYTQ